MLIEKDKALSFLLLITLYICMYNNVCIIYKFVEVQ